MTSGPAPECLLAGARLAPAGRTLDFEVGELRLATGDRVVVEVVDAPPGESRLAVVTMPSARRAARGPVGKVLRRALPDDLARAAEAEVRTQEALDFARGCAHDLGLEIKLFRAEQGGDTDKTVFYFSAEQRVDLGELALALAARYPQRLELRQVGVRDEAKVIGGIGSCGRELCCTTFLPRFAPVTIRMAKHQNLTLNPNRVSGQCGRLKCCLVYEEAQYLEASRLLPRIGRNVETPDGLGRVVDLEILAGKVRVSFPDRPPLVYEQSQLRRAASATDRGPDD